MGWEGAYLLGCGRLGRSGGSGSARLAAGGAAVESGDAQQVPLDLLQHGGRRVVEVLHQ